MADKEGKNNKKSDAALREERVLEFWKENKIFEKSLEKDSPKGNYVFYDGPPFATGIPHYGHILGSTVKDVIGRYQTMRGFRVPRRWGWDCHGLPIENIVEKDLGISGKKEIEKFGIDKFVEHARSKVLTYVHEWKKTVDRMGRWVDFDNSFKTMDNTFIESVWWALGELNKKELLYEGVKVLAYCPRCETPIANSEIAMDNSYKDITDISVYVKFKLVSEKNTYLLAWTTTPWTLPGNTAIAVNKNLSYLFIKNYAESGEEILVVAKDRFEIIKDKFKHPQIVKEVSGSDLVGLSYEPVFDYYKNAEMPNKQNIWKVWPADFVTIDMGTGIAHEAPAFGEDDMILAQKNNIPFIRHVEPNGTFSKEVVHFRDIKVKPKEDHQSGDVLIIKYLASTGSLFNKEKIIHSYPHCYRCDTPLLYYALPSWFVNIAEVKSELLEKAKEMNWIPEHLKEGRFKNIMENAPDWTISRNRYWASPLPIWKSPSGKIIFVNSLEDLKNKTKKSGNKYFVMRHGEAENNINNIYHKNLEHSSKLTEKGKKQVLESSKSFKEKIDIIICSPFERAKETAKIVCKEIDFPLEKIIYDERVQEWKLSSLFEGKERVLLKQYYDKDYLDNPKEILPDGESFAEVVKRVGDFIYDIEKKYSNKNILIVGHQGATRALSFIVRGLSFNLLSTKNDPFVFLKNAEVKKFDFVPLPHNEDYELDLHRPYIDAISIVDDKGEHYKRIPEVIDCWFESGSMPFAQDHYPFDNPDWKEKNFPAGFVAEYIAQTRTWFYYTHVISAILFGHAPFKNVVTTGTVLAEDGSKMSKSKNNFPDPWILFDKYGVDALRLYLMSGPLMKGEDVNFSEKSVQEISSKIIGRLFNVVTFYELYRDKNLENSGNSSQSADILDQWILSRLNQIIQASTSGMQAYDMTEASRPMEVFVEDLSTWYLRRSRERIKDGDKDAKRTLYFVLKTIAKIMAPFTPFTAEDIWLKLKNDRNEESVHLAEWPKAGKIDSLILKNMQELRKLVSVWLEVRQKAGEKVRQPMEIERFQVPEGMGTDYIQIFKDELNVKIKSLDYSMKMGTGIYNIGFNPVTPELKQEGNYRELVRALQEMRKKMGLTPSDVVNISFETDNIGKKLIQKFENDMKKTVLVSKIEFKNNDGEEIKIDDLVFKIKIETRPTERSFGQE